MTTIDNNCFDNLNNETNNSINEIKTWDELDLNQELLRGIFAYGFEKPSPIQQKAIKPIIERKDVVAQAQSGTGKTATFTIGALANVDTCENFTQVLILSPTKELTLQTAIVFENLGCMMNGLKIQTLYGGEGCSFSNKIVPHVICGCPGRVFEMMRRKKISSNKIKLIVLDEADEMLSEGFKDQVSNIFQYLSNDIQIVLVSATLNDNLNFFIKEIMRDTIRISVKREMLTLEGIQQFYIAVNDDKEKYSTLKMIYSHLIVSQCIIYCNSVDRVQNLYEAMKEDNFPVSFIHSEMDKSQRDTSFKEFKSGKFRVLISTNITARGIDIQQVSIVINFDLPKCPNTYLHRIGRSGRWGRKGVGINFITRRDIVKIKEIESFYSTQINELPINLSFLSSI